MFETSHSALQVGTGRIPDQGTKTYSTDPAKRVDKPVLNAVVPPQKVENSTVLTLLSLEDSENIQKIKTLKVVSDHRKGK